MLTEAQRALIRGSVPILQEHGVTLTGHFYRRMFSGNPELQHIFNRGHQGGRQQEALAAAVTAYAENIDTPAVLAGALTHIAHKHVSLGIRAEHYATVGRHLLASIREVLGEAATEELIDAWAAAYTRLAGMLTAEEQELYDNLIATPGGWTGWRPFRIIRKQKESSVITSCYLEPTDKGPVPVHKPGQFISIRVFVPEWNLMQPRQYSLSDAPDGRIFRISVKREDAVDGRPAGRVSCLLHNHFAEGDILDVSAPCGEFHLHNDGPVVLISGGVGITPMMSMLNFIVRSGGERKVWFFHATQSGETHAFRDHINNLTSGRPHIRKHITYGRIDRHRDVPGRDYDAGGFLDMAAHAEQFPDDVHCYLCGPLPFMQAQYRALVSGGIKPEHIHFEAFGTGGLSLR